MFRIFTNLYAKLIASAAVGVLLVAGMILNAQWSNGSIGRSHTSSQDQNAILKEVLLAQGAYLRGQIQRRNVVLAHNLADSEKAFEALKAPASRAALSRLFFTASRRNPSGPTPVVWTRCHSTGVRTCKIFELSPFL